jgi:hypothetical protein
MINLIVNNKKLIIACLVLILFSTVSFSQSGNLFFTDAGKVEFESDAPLEVIKASSEKLAGILNLDDRSFTFSIPMRSFVGFNSSLQQTHFNENYMESEKFPNSTFNGKIIEEVDFTQAGTIRIRAKGKLLIHGIVQDRIIRCDVTIGSSRIEVSSEFTVPLDDHNITIPSIVQQKIAEVIDVSISFSLKPMN